MKTLLVLDFHNMLYRAVHSMPYLTDGKDTYTGGLFGFLTQLTSHVNKHDAEAVIVCTDSPPYKRVELFPAYKERRKRERDEILYAKVNQSRALCEEMLSVLSIPIWREQGMEADDMIYHACNKFLRYDRIVVVSNDDDLFQLLESKKIGGNVIQLDRSGKLYTTIQFKQDYPGVSLRDWLWVLAMAGTHNGVPGIPRIGIKKALAIIAEDKLQETLKKYPQVKLFKRVIELPFSDGMKKQPFSPPVYCDRVFHEYLKKYNIQLTPVMHNALRRWRSIK
ncbi:MAG: hypothetical protein Q8M94_16220 [Ignavibacteria bacterium]|nr:hypothetical protein [Ignavibacteria bacterium]